MCPQRCDLGTTNLENCVVEHSNDSINRFLLSVVSRLSLRQGMDPEGLSWWIQLRDERCLILGLQGYHRVLNFWFAQILKHSWDFDFATWRVFVWNFRFYAKFWNRRIGSCLREPLDLVCKRTLALHRWLHSSLLVAFVNIFDDFLE